MPRQPRSATSIDSNTVDLVYLDPPFNKKREFAAPIGSSAEGASFQDIFREADVKEEWIGLIADRAPVLHAYLQGIGDVGHRSNKYYLCYMAVRLLELHRVLKETGSLYLHCDPTMSHYLKLLLDVVFGEHNFRNEIIWSYQGTGEPKTHFKRKHDVIFFYRKTEKSFFSDHNSREPISAFSRSKYTKKDKKGHYKEIRHPDGTLHRQYRRESQRIRDVWDLPIINVMSKERLGYPTQKPLALLERIIKASSNEGDLVLDPFCGCATTCVAAERLSRQWIGIDLSKKAYELVQKRLRDQQKAIGADLFQEKIVYRDDIPSRTDLQSASSELMSLSERKH